MPCAARARAERLAGRDGTNGLTPVSLGRAFFSFWDLDTGGTLVHQHLTSAARGTAPACPGHPWTVPRARGAGSGARNGHRARCLETRVAHVVCAEPQFSGSSTQVEALQMGPQALVVTDGSNNSEVQTTWRWEGLVDDPDTWMRTYGGAPVRHGHTPERANSDRRRLAGTHEGPMLFWVACAGAGHQH